MVNIEYVRLRATQTIVPYLTRGLRALVPQLPRALPAVVPYMRRTTRATCLTCSHAPLCLLPFVPSWLMCLVPYVLLCLMRFVPYVFSFLTCLVYSCTSGVLWFVFCWFSPDACTLCCMCSFVPHPLLTSDLSNITYLYASHVS